MFRAGVLVYQCVLIFKLTLRVDEILCIPDFWKSNTPNTPKVCKALKALQRVPVCFQSDRCIFKPNMGGNTL